MYVFVQWLLPTTGGKSPTMGWRKMIKSVIINGRKRETNHHPNLLQIQPSNVTTATKSVDQGSDFTATGYAVFKNDSTKVQSPLSNMTDGCQQKKKNKKNTTTWYNSWWYTIYYMQLETRCTHLNNLRCLCIKWCCGSNNSYFRVVCQKPIIVPWCFVNWTYSFKTWMDMCLNSYVFKCFVNMFIYVVFCGASLQSKHLINQPTDQTICIWCMTISSSGP